jgi:NAD(P)-dependent dehydrogenase (short-subunit alcohol dehydrogenase family)
MIQYQRMMQHFLETQKNVMMAFLQQGTWPADHPVPDAANYAPLAAPSMPAGQPADSGQSRLSPMPEAPIEEKGAAAIPKGMTRAAAMGVRVTEAEESGAPSDRFGCLRRGLIKVVSDRTGYPEEMLNLDFDIEAELGIDSIKRVEIMSSFAKGLTEREQANLQPVMGELSRLKTLRAVLEKAAALAGVHSANASADAQVCEPDLAGRESVQSVGDGKELVPRFVIDTAINPHSGSPQQLPRGGTFIVTDDRRGLSAHIADAVRKNGCRAVVLRNRTGSVGSASDEDGYSVDFSDAASLNEAIASIAGRYGPIAGLLHLAALDSSGPPDRSSLSAWRDHLKADTKTLLFLAQSLSDNLRDAGKRGKAWLLAATALAENSNPHPESSLGQAGMAGFIKTLAKEWPDVDCRIVHLDLVNPVPVLADQVLGELLASEGNIETAYPGTRRVVSVARLSSLDRTAQERISVKQDWVILVTGGAAGITAGISRMMAERYRPILILAGRSPFPEWQEPADTVGLSGEKELKTTIFNQMKSSGDAPTPAAVDRVWAHLMKEREIRENVDQMRKAGATVRYFQADVRDENVFGGLVDEIYRTYGRLDGVIHGAGVIEDKLVEAKSAESFDRVFDTKVASAFVLSRKLKPESLKFFVFFTSVAGFYGNRGQADYAAANEVLNELSRYLDERWPGRVVAVNWGPWKRIGMVTPEMERQFREKGIQLIPLDAGVRLLDEEIRFGKKGEVELVVGDGPWRT